MHKPVLQEEVMQYLNPQPGEFIIDGTINGGGHAEVILEKIGKDGTLLGLDWDGAMIANAREKFAGKNVVLRAANYINIPNILTANNLDCADGLLLDLGFSSTQLSAGRGFSYREDEPLLMTYSNTQTPLKDLLGELSEAEIADIIYKYGEERFSRRIARAIYKRQKMDPITTSAELAQIVKEAVPRSYERGRMHPATRTFQAFRIYVNRELENLSSILESLVDILAEGGRAVIISFHSLEDRIVKHAFKDLDREGLGTILTKKPVSASPDETKDNPRARSAKLRAFQLT